MKKVNVLVDVTDPENVFVHKGVGKKGWMRKGRKYVRVELTPLDKGTPRYLTGHALSMIVVGLK